MKFGVRQIANVVFRANANTKIGSVNFKKGQPVLYIDTAKTSSMESSATTVYATGGRGNTRLVTWEGEKTLTFTVEDALISPTSFAMLSGAGVIKGASDSTKTIHFHQTTRRNSSNHVIDLSDALLEGETICMTAPLYVMKMDENGDLTGEIVEGWAAGTNAGTLQNANAPDSSYMVDYYVIKKDNSVTELQIDAGSFGGSYYVEADTLFRRQGDNKDLPANITFPNVKIQSNFTFSMAATGDPSTFSFVMDAMPGTTYFNSNKKVLCAIQIAEDNVDASTAAGTVFPHPAEVENGQIIESMEDSVSGYTETSEDTSWAATATGITIPAISVASGTATVPFNIYYNVNGKLYQADPSDFDYSGVTTGASITNGVLTIGDAESPITFTATHKTENTLTASGTVTVAS